MDGFRRWHMELRRWHSRLWIDTVSMHVVENKTVDVEVGGRIS